MRYVLGSTTMDPVTGRVTEHYANAALCRLAGGASVPEHLARVAARALPEHVTQVDYLCRWFMKRACLCCDDDEVFGTRLLAGEELCMKYSPSRLVIERARVL